MDSVQLMMAAHQADANLAAQTTDQALQAAIAQSRPDLWGPLSTNPAAYADLLGWLASTGNEEVLANLRARGYLFREAAVGASGDSEPAAVQEASPEAKTGCDVEELADTADAESTGQAAPIPEQSPDQSRELTQDDQADTPTDATTDMAAEEVSEEAEPQQDGEEPADDVEGQDQEEQSTEGPSSDDSTDEEPADAGDTAEPFDGTTPGGGGEDCESEAPEASESDVQDPAAQAPPIAPEPDLQVTEPDDAAGETPPSEDDAGHQVKAAVLPAGLPQQPPTDSTGVAATAQAAPADPAVAQTQPVTRPPVVAGGGAWAEASSFGAPSAPAPAPPLGVAPGAPDVQPPPSQKAKAATSRRPILVAALVVALLVVVGAGGAWAGSHFANKGKDGGSSDTSQNKADSDGGEDGKQNGQADAAATSTAAALPSGAVKACSSMPTFTITSVEDGQGELKVHGNMATSCAEGDFLAGSSSQVLVYSSTSPTGGADVDHLVASGTFDLSSDPLIIPNGGRAVTLRFGEQHYFRTAKDLDLKGLTVRPSFDRGSSSTATAKSSTNSAMTIASSASSNANQEAQDEQAAGDAIQWQIKHDYPIVMNSLRGKWTPQLSSKQVGLVADGQTWTKRAILAEYLKTQQANPKAVIIDTSQWPVYDTGGWWVTLQGDTYSDGDQANAWCDAQGYDSDHCLAKRIESNGTSQGTTKLR